MNRHSIRGLLLIGLMGATGCLTPIGVSPMNRADVRRLLSADAVSADVPSISSHHVTLRLGIANLWQSAPEEMLARLHTRTLEEFELDQQTTGDRLFALTEYSYLHAAKLQTVCSRPIEPAGNRGRMKPVRAKPYCEGARAYYIAASLYAYAYVFPDDGRAPPGGLDPRLRTAVDIYNLAVTAAIRHREGTIDEGSLEYSFHLGEVTFEIDPAGLEYIGYRLGDLVPAAQLHVRGLRNRYRQAGIGAPFLARAIPQEGVERPLTSARVADELRVPITIFVRYGNATEGLRSGEFRGRIETYNENHTTQIQVAGRSVPLEYETSAALAYSLEYSKMWDFEIAGFRSGDALPVADGLVMLRPYQPGKIPVVLVHGTASSPARWAEMLNEYQSDPILRTKYQFWLFMYTTGNPVLFSASLLRESLQNTLAEVDPDDQDPALRRMIVVGHSQGGLLTKLQAISSGTRFWDGFSEVPFEEIDVQPETRRILRKAIFFEPQPFIERVVFISTPHRGSFLAGTFLGRIASSLFRAPTELVGLSLDLALSGVSLARDAVSQPGFILGLFRTDEDEELRERLARPSSSVDNMDPSSAFTRSLQSIPVADRIRANSIIPVLGSEPPDGKNDGVVEYSSAHIDEAESEYVVYHSDHSTQGHPETIQELRRILLKHVALQ